MLVQAIAGPASVFEMILSCLHRYARQVSRIDGCWCKEQVKQRCLAFHLSQHYEKTNIPKHLEAITASSLSLLFIHLALAFCIIITCPDQLVAEKGS